MLEEHVQHLVGHLLEEERLSPSKRGIIHVAAQQAGQLECFRWWFSRLSPVFTSNGRIYLQPAFQAYMKLMTQHANTLKLLGVHEVSHVPAREFAQAVIEAQEVPSDNDSDKSD